MLDPLPITPFSRPVRGNVMLPGSKSITNRAMLLAALSQKPVTLTGALFSEDTQLMAVALRALGIQVDENPEAKSIRIYGRGGEIPVEKATLFVGMAGTAARFLTALCAAAPKGIFTIDGNAQMRKRPMKGLIDALRTLGAKIDCTENEGHFPITIHASGLKGGAVEIDATESSQMLSALLMVAPLARADTLITMRGGVRWPFVEMTMQMMAEFGQPPLTERTATGFTVKSGRAYGLAGGSYAVEPDATAASYFLALPLVARGKLNLPGMRGLGRGLQGDAALLDVLRDIGLEVDDSAGGVRVSFAGTAKRYSVSKDFSGFSDTFLTIAALSPLFTGKTVISGIAHTRKQETDRVAGMARELQKLGQSVVEKEDSLEITPAPLKENQEIETYHDHRFAMSFGILGSHDLRGNGTSWLAIKDPGCCAKTFPNFFEVLESLRKSSL